MTGCGGGYRCGRPKTEERGRCQQKILAVVRLLNVIRLPSLFASIPTEHPSNHSAIIAEASLFAHIYARSYRSVMPASAHSKSTDSHPKQQTNNGLRGNDRHRITALWRSRKPLNNRPARLRLVSLPSTWGWAALTHPSFCRGGNQVGPSTTKRVRAYRRQSEPSVQTKSKSNLQGLLPTLMGTTGTELRISIRTNEGTGDKPFPIHGRSF
ncbi:hypothetical protein BJ508DRAFT_36170 [Ascobolus immersus RN42]|uniref:Uncharacterized protein n=1 Tax=Ascobolus immersus RN42 TaxID=1160509 RepID=A0A3N4HKF3_ASCIM|nr:hypothetical protein BJ508DRAFT_36170 [Ascobolus immersus RN42]